MERYDKLRASRWIGLALAGMSLSLLFVTTTFSKGQARGIAEPAFWPRIVLVLLLVLSLVMAIGAWLELRKAARPRRGVTVQPATGEDNNRKLALTILGSGAYLLALGPIGFLASTPLYVGALVAILEERRLARIVAVALFADLLFYVLFVKVVSYELPRGAGVFRDLSLLLY